MRMEKLGKYNTIVSEVKVDRQEWKPVGASMGSNAEPISCLEVTGELRSWRLYSKETE